MSDTSPRLPLTGVRVLDLSRVLAGPMCGMALADLGAEVIKIEHPGRGDDTRDWGLRVGQNNSAYFNSANRNKLSVGLDLQTAEGQRIARALAAKCDVVIQNFKFGGAEKLGLGYDDLRKDNPKLVYCSIAGYNRSGDEAARPGYDLVVQGESGLMAINGDAGQGPLKFGVAVVDMTTGLLAAQSILAALFDAQRTGEGRHVEHALYDSGVAITAYYGMEALMNGADTPKFGNAHPSIIPYGVFEAADGPLVITVGNNAQFARFCEKVIDRPDLAADERFKTNNGRSQHREILVKEINGELARRQRAELLPRLNAAGIPCGEVLGLMEALTSERATKAGLFTSTNDYAGAGEVPVMAPPYRMDGVRLPVRNAPPELAAHTRHVLSSVLGMQDADIDQLKADGVL